MSSAASRARDAFANLTPQDREHHRVDLVVVELLADMADSLAQLVEQGRAGGRTPDSSSTDTAGTPTGAGRSVAGPDPGAGVDQDGDPPVKVLTTEPERPPTDLVDDDQAPEKKAVPAPPKKATPAAAKKTSRTGR